MRRAAAALALALAGGAVRAAPAPQPAPLPPAAGLQAIGDAGQAVSLTTADLAALPRETVSAAPTHDSAPRRYEGARLTDVLRAVGAPLGPRLHGPAVRDVVVATGADGYRAVFSLAETDPANHAGARILIADRVDGAPLDAKEGPLRLVVDGDLRPARSVHNLVRVEVRRLP